MPTIRLRSRNPGPPPQDVLAKPEPKSEADLARLAAWWLLNQEEVKHRLFLAFLYQKGRVKW